MTCEIKLFDFFSTGLNSSLIIFIRTNYNAQQEVGLKIVWNILFLILLELLFV